MNESLKPCGLCGGEARYNRKQISQGCVLVGYDCKQCGAAAPVFTGPTAIEKSMKISAAKAWNRRAAPENKPLTLHFGDGKIGVSTCHPEKSNTLNGLLLWNPKIQQHVGDAIPVKDGTTTDDVEVYAKLFFSNAESAQVVIDALNRIIDSYGGNEPLTVEQLKSMQSEPVWVKSLLDGTVKGAVINNTHSAAYVLCGVRYDTFDNYGKTWFAYTHKPEGSEKE